MKRAGRPRRLTQLLVPLALVAALLVSGCDDFVFRTLLEGENGAAYAGSLSISPKAVSLNTGGTVTFNATGGSGVYAFSAQAPGTIDPSTGAYTAPGVAGTYTATVTDTTGTSSQATITVSAGAGTIVRARRYFFGATGSACGFTGFAAFGDSL